jgi:excisionase family DNA binding protein
LASVPKPNDSFTQVCGNEELPLIKMDINEMFKDAIKTATQAAIDEMKLARANKFMTPQEVADAIGDVDEATIRRWCRNGELSYHQLGKFLRIAVEDFNAFCAKRRLAHY